MNLRRIAKNIAVTLYRHTTPLLHILGLGETVKGHYEFTYWKSVWRDEVGAFKNGWYEWYYTTAVGLRKEDYVGKRVLDIRCGPRGSLEWCDRAAERVGLDPLVDRYRKFGIDKHKMSY
jgi:hypothetical protein